MCGARVVKAHYGSQRASGVSGRWLLPWNSVWTGGAARSGEWPARRRALSVLAGFYAAGLNETPRIPHWAALDEDEVPGPMRNPMDDLQILGRRPAPRPRQ